jgi:hypothetical protein
MIASAYSYRLASQHWLRAGRQHDLAACTARAFEHLVQDVLVASKVRYVVEPLSGTAPRPASAIGANRTSRDRFCRFLGETPMTSSVSGFERRRDPVELAQDRAIEAPR